MKLNLGQLVVTREVNAKMAINTEFTKFIMNALAKYRNCNWGQTCKEDWELNDKAVINDWRVVAKYKNERFEVFIITEWDRSATTILFPNEY